MENSAYVKERVIELRGKSGLTQEEVADRLGLSRQRYISVEKGERELAVDELEILAELFGVTVTDFFFEKRNNEKFKQMYFMFVRLAGKENGIPKTKLAKLLYLADFRNYFEALEPMSGAQYIRREYGPVADIFFELTEDLFDTGKINIQPLGKALMIKSTSRYDDDSELDKDEKQRIHEIAQLWKHKRTEEIVNFTHEQLPWKMCRDGERIPYSLIVQEEPDHVFKPVTG